MKICIPLLIIGLFFFTCTNNELPNPQEQNPCDDFLLTTLFNDTCFELPQLRPPEIVETGEYAFVQPSFDRINQHRFLYRQAGGTDAYLVVDKCKETYTKVVDGALAGRIRPQLGQNGWVAYCTTLEELMIKKIGDEEVIHILQEYKCTQPFWLSSVNQVMCLAEGENNTYKTILADTNGQIVRIIDNALFTYAEYNNKIAGYTGNLNNREIGYLDMSDDFNFIPVTTLSEEAQRIIAMDWLDENHMVWTDVIGLHKVNIQTGDMITLKENCGNRAMAYFSIPPNRDGTIILGQANYTPEEDGLNKDISIHRYDTNTGIQERFELEPQF